MRRRYNFIVIPLITLSFSLKQSQNIWYFINFFCCVFWDTRHLGIAIPWQSSKECNVNDDKVWLSLLFLNNRYWNGRIYKIHIWRKDTQFHTTHENGCDRLFMLVLKLICVSKGVLMTAVYMLFKNCNVSCNAPPYGINSGGDLWHPVNITNVLFLLSIT